MVADGGAFRQRSGAFVRVYGEVSRDAGIVRGSAPFGVTRQASRPGLVDLAQPAIRHGARPATPLRGSVSWRWLSGTVLTGITSTLLMGGALLTALDGPAPLIFSGDSAAVAQAEREFPPDSQKGDRIRPIVAPVTSRQVVQVSTISQLDDREVIRLAPFVRVNASLVTRQSDIARDIPPFDPMQIIGEEADAPAEPALADQIYGADVDGEVAIKVSPFPLGGGAGPAAADLAAADPPRVDFDAAEAERMVREAAGLIGDGAVHLAALPYLDPGGAPDTGQDDPFAALDVRIIPENVTFIPRSERRGEETPAADERIATTIRNESFPELLARSDIGEEDAANIALAIGQLVDLGGLGAGETVRLAFAPSDVDGGTPRPIRVSIYRDGVHQATVARTDDQTFIRADEPAALPEALAAARPVSGQMPRFYEALYQTARDQSVPEPLIKELVRIFSYDLDFQSRITPGDAIEIFHSLADAAGRDDENEILYAALTIGGVTKRFYRYQTPDDGVIDYYDEEGRSAKKFLMRKPLNEGRLTSAYGNRRHPVLGYLKLHTGVDWAAPRGTPIMAAGDGIVVSAGWNSGYGRYTRLRHANGYETAYAHQDRIANGVVPGAKVRQGQIIGYIGSTGLSTGPHLHYEVRINDRLVDPLEIRLPRGRVLEGDMLAAFDGERARIDALLGNSPDPTQLAANR